MSRAGRRQEVATRVAPSLAINIPDGHVQREAENNDLPTPPIRMNQRIPRPLPDCSDE